MNSGARPWTGLGLALLALGAGLRPAWGAPLPDGRVAVDAEPSACCLEPGERECCPEDEGGQPEASYLPPCCGVDAPAGAPAERGPAHGRAVVDPTAKVLGELARAQRLSETVTCDFTLGSRDRAEAAHAPPEDSGATGHWWTEREVLEALALLSVARL